MTRVTPWVMTIALILSGCGSGGENDVEGLADPVCISGQGTPAPDFVGLTQEEATELAEERGLQVREVGREGECFAVTMDLRDDRVNLEYVDDVVVGAAIY